MLIEASGIPLPLDAGLPGGETLITKATAEALGLDVSALGSVELLRRSVDARKNTVRFIATLVVDCPHISDLAELRPAKGVNVQLYTPPESLEIPHVELPANKARPLVVGSGPAGLFAALYLAKTGLQPVVLERGGSIDERIEAVEAFVSGHDLDLQTNIQFGEGGAGTFSDGKLTTGTKSPLQRDILNWFVQAGAPEEIRVLAKPHIGTDNLQTVVKNLRSAIEDQGGTVLFHAQLYDIELNEAQKLQSAVVKVLTKEALEKLLACYPNAVIGEDFGAAYGSTESKQDTQNSLLTDLAEGASDSSLRALPLLVKIPVEKLILSCGHSARDTFKMLQRHDVLMEQKPFSIGVRIEHLQKDIDEAQYGSYAGHPALGAADYKMAVHLPNGRSAYTFCMCPGGEVVAAASEEYGVAVNGMSRFARAGKNANAAVLVNVEPRDFGSSDPLAGMALQRRIEQEAFGEAHEMGGEAWSAPVQTVGDFLSEQAGNPSKTVTPTYPRGVVWCDLHEVFPDFVNESLELALPLFDKKLKGFAHPEAVMTGVETRSSSPVRIVRDAQTFQAQLGKAKKLRPRDIARGRNVSPLIFARNIGLYPCGEGAGYAGGIMSAAVDGIRCAQALAASYENDEQFAHAVEALKQGEAIIFPTDTVYGLGVSVDHAPNPQVLYDLKEREAGKPIAWLVGSVDDLQKYGKNISKEVLQAVQEQWPGAFTVIVEASDAVPRAYQSSEGTIGLRMPNNDLVLNLIRETGSPLATTSANLSGDASARELNQINPQLFNRVSVILQDDSAGQGSASTVVDYSQGQPIKIRS